MARVALALQQYQKEDTAFPGFSSKYDEFLRGNAKLSDREARGLAKFNDPVKGNCLACHPSARGADGSLPLCTDFSYDNLGVRRNPDGSVRKFYDLPERFSRMSKPSWRPTTAARALRWR